MSDQKIFKRYEKKYLIDEADFQTLMKKLSPRVLPDKYPEGVNCSLYYDTPDGRIIRASLEKPIYKEKLRIRSYGTPTEQGKVFVELKKKYDGVVYKRRVSMTHREALLYLKGGTPPAPGQITREIDWFKKSYPRLSPAMYIAYDRLSFMDKENPLVRITFDTNIRWRQDGLRLSGGVWGSQLLLPGQRIMEIKVPDAIPLWLAGILSELEIFPTGYSKYGNAYKASLLLPQYHKIAT